MTSDQETLAIIILGIHPDYAHLYKKAIYGDHRYREWQSALQLADKIVAAGFSSVRFN